MDSVARVLPMCHKGVPSVAYFPRVSTSRTSVRSDSRLCGAIPGSPTSRTASHYACAYGIPSSDAPPYHNHNCYPYTHLYTGASPDVHPCPPTDSRSNIYPDCTPYAYTHIYPCS